MNHRRSKSVAWNGRLVFTLVLRHLSAPTLTVLTSSKARFWHASKGKDERGEDLKTRELNCQLQTSLLKKICCSFPLKHSQKCYDTYTNA